MEKRSNNIGVACKSIGTQTPRIALLSSFVLAREERRGGWKQEMKEWRESLVREKMDLIREDFCQRIGFLQRDLGRSVVLETECFEGDLEIEKMLVCCD
jgi:hypothetical protein